MEFSRKYDQERDKQYQKEKEENTQAYERLKHEIKTKHPDKYAAIFKGKLVAVADTYDEALKKAEEAEPVYLHCYIFKAGDEHVTDTLYIS